jgi:uncharacterized pyridoxal phosphate-containing UPF0001 family protein
MNDEQRIAYVAERLHIVRSRIQAAGGVDVAILPVTKTWGIEWCMAAHGAGCTEVGENYAQEVVAKLSSPARPFGVRFIGQLQTNKVRMLAPLVQVYETVDRPSLVRELATRVPGARVLVQVAPVDFDDATSKGGCVMAEVPALVDAARTAGLDVLGLMAVGPTVGGPEAARPTFRAVRSLVDRLGLRQCSMGMSDDLEVAVQEGSTQVRVGSALFGERPRFGTTVR